MKKRLTTVILAALFIVGTAQNTVNPQQSPDAPRRKSGPVITNETLKNFRRNSAESSEAISVKSLTPEQKAWALATSALLTERNRRSHELLSELEPTGQNIQQQRQSLSDWWDVQGRSDLLERLKWIDEGGHRQSFEKLAQVVFSFSEDQRNAFRQKVQGNEEAFNQLQSVEKHYTKLGKKSLLGWDYSRYVSLCRWGYLVGFLTEDEAWSKILYAAKKIQSNFESWKDLGENYLIGREFWSIQETHRNGQLYRETYLKLLRDPQSPWNRYRWDLPLN